MPVLGMAILIALGSGDASGRFLAALHAQSDPKTAHPFNPPAGPKTTLTDLAWLAGRWQGVWGPRLAQQVWMPSRAGVMLGTLQISENDRMQVVELMSLTETAGGIEFRIRHFTPELMAWENSAPIMLRSTGYSPRAIFFENPGDDQPKRLIFTPQDADTYVSRSEIVPNRGDTQVTEIVYHRQKESPAVRH